MEDTAAHYSKVRRVLFNVLLLNWGVAAAKIAFGLISRSASMTADGFHSFSDGASNIVGLVGIAFACQPRDKDHPYGHKKYETFFSLGIAFLLGIVCFELFQEGVKRLYKPILPDINIVSFAVMAVTLMINIVVMRYERRKGEELNSDILVSDATHTKADILTSVSVIVSFIAIKLGFPVIDAVATLGIALFVAYAAYEIMREGSRILCDEAAIIDDKRVREIVLKINGVKSCHNIRTRGRRDDINLDLHVQVKPNMHIDKAHKISDEIESELRKNIPGVSDVVVHMEPTE